MNIGNHCRGCWAALIVLVLMGSTWRFVHAQDTYIPTPGMAGVRDLVDRLEKEGDNIPKEIRRTVLAEGKLIIEEENRGLAGDTPLQRELRAANAKWKSLDEERARLKMRKEELEANANTTQEDADALNTAMKDCNKRFAAHKRYVNDDLTPRVEAANASFKKRIARFGLTAVEQIAALSDAQSIKDATSKGRRPSFKATWNYQQYNREVAELLAPKEDRCALVLSMTLGLKVRKPKDKNEKAEAGLKDVASVLPVVQGADVANAYVRAGELAKRLRSDWKKPEEFTPATAEQSLQNRKGLIFFDGGYGNNGAISHIDLWDGEKKQLGDDLPPAFKEAKGIWFWSMPD